MVNINYILDSLLKNETIGHGIEVLFSELNFPKVLPSRPMIGDTIESIKPKLKLVVTDVCWVETCGSVRAEVTLGKCP